MSSSISGGVALIGAAATGNAKFHSGRDKEPVLIGTVEITLNNFRRGEWVVGWWSVLSAGPGGPGAAELKMKIKVDE